MNTILINIFNPRDLVALPLADRAESESQKSPRQAAISLSSSFILFFSLVSTHFNTTLITQDEPNPTT
jgi:hypothetical protein